MLEMQKKLTNLFYVVLSLPSTAMGFALSVQISALSWIMNTQYGLDLHEIGIVWAAGPLAGILGQPIVGWISDGVWFWGGRRKPFIFIGGTLAALMLFLLPNIGNVHEALGLFSILVVATAVALTLDLAINISFNPTRSIIADVTPEGDKRTKGYTWMQTISGTFGVLAYAVGAIFGNFTLIYFSVFLVLAFSILPMLVIREPRELTHINDNPDSEVKREKTNVTEFVKVLLSNSFSWIGVQTMFVYIIGFIQQKLNPATNDETGQIISISFLILNAVGALVPYLMLQPMTEKFGRIKTQVTSLVIMAAAYACVIFFGTSVLNLYIFIGIAGIGWGAIVSLPFAIMSETVGSERMGFYMGIFNLSVVIPQLIASLVIGYFIEIATDKSLIFIISAVTVGISALLWSTVKETKKA